jgi:hypothetical protein
MMKSYWSVNYSRLYRKFDSAVRSSSRAGSLPSSGHDVRRFIFQPCAVRFNSHRLAPTRWDAVAARGPVAGNRDRLRGGVRCQDLEIGDHHRVIAVDGDVRQAGKVCETAGDRRLVLGRARDGRHCFVAARGLASAEVDCAVLQ